MMQSDVIEADLNRITVTDPFLGEYQRLIRDVVIPYQWEALNDNIPDAEPSHALANYRIAAGQEDGQFYGMVFQDSDVTKWLEAVAWSLSQNLTRRSNKPLTKRSNCWRKRSVKTAISIPGIP